MAGEYCNGGDIIHANSPFGLLLFMLWLALVVRGRTRHILIPLNPGIPVTREYQIVIW